MVMMMMMMRWKMEYYLCTHALYMCFFLHVSGTFHQVTTCVTESSTKYIIVSHVVESCWCGSEEGCAQPFSDVIGEGTQRTSHARTNGTPSLSIDPTNPVRICIRLILLGKFEITMASFAALRMTSRRAVARVAINQQQRRNLALGGHAGPAPEWTGIDKIVRSYVPEDWQRT